MPFPLKVTSPPLQGLSRWGMPLLFLVVSGCALFRPPHEAILPPASAAKAWLMALQTWSLEGRFAAPGRISGKLRWRHVARHDELILLGPLGMGAVSLDISPEGVEIQQGERRFRVDSPETLFEKFGLQVPWEAFRYWIRGLPAPGDAKVIVRRDGYPAELRQEGWRVVYHRYLPAGPAALPKRLTLFGPDGVQLKLVIDRWEIERHSSPPRPSST